MNLELVEVCYLLSCVFMDVAAMVADVCFCVHDHVQRSNIYKISAFFKRYYDRYRRHVFLRPDTDSLRVLAAYEAILVPSPRESHL